MIAFDDVSIPLNPSRPLNEPRIQKCFIAQTSAHYRCRFTSSLCLIIHFGQQNFSFFSRIQDLYQYQQLAEIWAINLLALKTLWVKIEFCNANYRLQILSNLSCMFLNPNIFFNLNSNCSNLLDLRNLQQ